MKRLHATISGRVQGVGYRAWICCRALDLSLTGWAKNTDDGAVETAAEGPREQLEEFIRQCRRGPQTARVKNIEISWETATGKLGAFRVIY